MKEYDMKYKDYVGIDESGLGNVSGSLIFCGAKIKEGYSVQDISFADDSKSISKKKRAEFYYKLLPMLDYLIYEISPSFIDENGKEEACRVSLEAIKEYFKGEEFIYDGNNSHKVNDLEMLVKADAKVSIVSAASIIAKVKKDLRMEKCHEKYPEYDWKNNAGYCTKKHVEAIKKYGWTEYHRRSYKIKALEGLDIKEHL